MNNIILAGVLSITVFLTGCNGGTSSENVLADSTSGFKYKKMSCDELEYELDYLEKKERKASALVDSVKEDKQELNAAAFLFCFICAPFIDDNSAQVAKLAEVKGELDGVERAYSGKCMGNSKK